MTRLVALLATVTLALAVLFRSASDYRMAVCIVVSLAAITFALRFLLTGKFIWAIPFLCVLGVFTPFQISRFSPSLISVVDMASMALFAASPMILKKSTIAVVPPVRY